jgi:hypothetical protein
MTNRLSGFSINIGDATLDWVLPVVTSLYNEANTYVNNGEEFYIYLSMDVYASGAACYAGGASCNGPFDYAKVLDYALAQPSYAKAPNSNPVITSKNSILIYVYNFMLADDEEAFSSGGFTNDNWTGRFSECPRNRSSCP